MAAPVLSYENLGLVQGSGWLFRGLDIHIGARERLALIGRNGAGKSTLLRLLANRIEADTGKRIIVPGTRVVLLEQDPSMTEFVTLQDFVMHGAEPPQAHAVAAIADQIGIDLSRRCDTASGGERRRAALTRALASQPDVLLLDEPTNHLDLAAIDWLEGWLMRFRGAFIVISHDRTFLTRLTRETLWIERGTLRRKAIGFGGFEAWMETIYAQEARASDRLDAKLAIEAHWLERGVTARRKRNQGRLEKLYEMRAQRAEMLAPAGTAKLGLAKDDVKTKSVITAENVSKSFGDHTIIRDFSLRIQRGDRIGLVGANGTGKTTLLKLLTGELAPDSGKVTRAKSLNGIVIDQQRALMQPNKRVRDILADGGDWIEVRGVKKHIKGYLKDFLFDPALSEARVSTLSGGEQSRLLLAREFARESNLLVLDEPTNDLDLETLDLLQEVIADYEGTVLLVSHDRDFLNRTVTMTLGLDGTGNVDIVAGGYAEWVAYKSAQSPQHAKANKPAASLYGRERPEKNTGSASAGARARGSQKKLLRERPEKAASVLSALPLAQALAGGRAGKARQARKLTYKDQRDYDLLPTRIEAIDAAMASAELELADPDLYSKKLVRFEALTTKMGQLRAEKSAAEDRWLSLAAEVEALNTQ